MGSRGITLHGEAARAFIEGAMDRPLGAERKKLSEDDKYLVIATKIAMLMKTGKKPEAKAAVELLKALDEKDLETVYQAARVI